MSHRHQDRRVQWQVAVSENVSRDLEMGPQAPKDNLNFHNSQVCDHRVLHCNHWNTGWIADYKVQY